MIHVGDVVKILTFKNGRNGKIRNGSKEIRTIKKIVKFNIETGNDKEIIRKVW